MPTNIPIPKFLTQKGTEPKWTTEEYWARFQYSVISAIKSKPDDVMTKHNRAAAPDATVTLTDEETLNMEVLKGAFLEALGDDAIFEIQQRNPKEKVYLQTVDWIKTKWEECYRSSRNVTENLVKTWNGTRPKETTVLQHWMEVGERVAQCKLDSMTAKDIEEHIHVAAFLSTVNEPKQAKSLWEKKGTKAELAEYIPTTAEAEKELERIQKKNQKERPSEKSTETNKVKEEPVGKISHRKSKRSNKGKDGNRDRKDKNCFRCGEPNWTPDHSANCKARKAKCKRCGKIGHFEKYCKSKNLDQRDKRDQEKVKRIDSSDSEGTDCSSSDTDTYISDSEESVKRIREIRPSQVNHNIERLPVRAIRPGRRTRQLNRTGREFEFKICLNGRKVIAILDTGSPISILPKKYKSEVRPKRVIKRASSRRFVDVNGKPITIDNRYKIPTKLNGIEEDTVWWEVDTDTKPIIGMDNFDKLVLQLIQRKTKKVQNEQIQAIQTDPETEKPTKTSSGDRKSEIGDFGSRKDEIADYGHRKDANSKLRKTEEIKTRNFGARRSEKTPSRSPKAAINVATVPETDKNNTEDPEIEKRRLKITGQFKTLFSENKTVKNFEYNVQFKRDMTVTQQKGRRVPIHIQKAVEKEVNKLVKGGHLEKLTEVGEDIFVSPVVITHKSDGTVKIALDSIELNKQVVKKTMQLPSLAELLDRISIKISRNGQAQLHVSTIDLDYAFGQIALHQDTAKHCVAAIVGGKATGHYRFQKGFYGLADMPVVFQTKIDKVLNYETPAW